MIRKTRKKDKLPVVEIHWVDSMGDKEGWQDRDYMKDQDMRIRTVGLLVAEDHESYTVSASQSFNNDTVDHPMKIPKVAVTGCWEIKL